MSTTKQQTIPNLIVIDKEWANSGLESVNIIVANYEDNKLFKDSEYWRYKGMQSLCKSILSNSYPLSPIVEDAWGKSYERSLENTTSLTCQTNDMYEYLSQPIKLKK